MSAPGTVVHGQLLDQLRHFLAKAPTAFPPVLHDNELVFKHFILPVGEAVSCVRWNGTFLLTGTDVVRILLFRFLLVGRPVHDRKKFEEGVFSDLRNLKTGKDAVLEPAKSPLLAALFKHDCVNTQKKQKLFLWFSVPHDRLFLDALARDLRRERVGQPTTSRVIGSLAPWSSPALELRQTDVERAAAGVNPTRSSVAGQAAVRSCDDRLAPLLGTVHLFEGAATYKRRDPPSASCQDVADRPHGCTFPRCGRRFKRLEHLQRHLATHTREKPHVCAICGKAFSRSDNAAIHQRLHGERSAV